MKLIYSLIVMIFSLCMVACGSHDRQATAGHRYVVSAKPLRKVMHFTGTVQPISETSLISPSDAIIEQMNVHYGQLVKKDQVVFTLSSTELQKQYNEALTEYLKAKDSYSIAQAKFIGTQDLWKAGLIAKNNFLSEQSSVDTAHISLMQATRKLNDLMERLDEKNTSSLSSLRLADFAKIKNMLASNHQLIHIKAPSAGIMLYPPKNNEDKGGRIAVGTAVKSGQVVALIGNLTGISVEIDIPEIDIDKVYAGMQARISGIAFGQQVLTGRVIAVNAQASNSSAAGLPSFMAVVEVPELTAEQQKHIKVGMSAVIDLESMGAKKLFIPIEAITRDQGLSTVKVQTEKGRVEKRRITTGAAQADSVVVEQGLNIGDVILYD